MMRMSFLSGLNIVMSSLTSRQPANINYLQQTNFIFTVRRLPNFDTFVQAVKFPGLTLGDPVGIPRGPFSRMAIPGDHLVWENLDVTFKVDENLSSWLDIFNWMNELGLPDSTDKFAALMQNDPISGTAPTPDATYTIFDGLSRPVMRFEFQDLTPVSLSGFITDSTVSGEIVKFVTATATFRYTLYSATRIAGANTAL